MSILFFDSTNQIHIVDPARRQIPDDRHEVGIDELLGSAQQDRHRARRLGAFVVADDAVQGVDDVVGRIDRPGAATTAALLSGVVDAKGASVAVVVSGGNLDPSLLAKLG